MRIGLFTKFVVVMLALSVVPVAILAWMLIDINRRGLEDKVLEHHQAVARGIAEKLDAHIAAFLERVRFAVASGRYKATGEADKAQEDFLRTLVPASPDFATASLVSPSGEELMLLASPALEPQPEFRGYGLSPAFQRARQFKTTQLSPVYYKGEDPRLDIIAPLGKEYLCISVTLRDIWRSIRSSTSGKTGFSYLVDERGRILTHPTAPLLSPADNPLIEAALLSQEGSREYPSKGGKWIIGSYAPVKSLGWGALFEQDKNESYQAVTRMKRNALFLVAAMVLLVSLGAYLLARGMSRPILSVIEGAREVSRGNFSHVVRVKTHDELRTLAETFNLMTRQLDEFHKDKLIAEQRKTEAIIFSIADGIVLTDHEGKILLANEPARRLLGSELEEEASLFEAVGQPSLAKTLAEVVGQPEKVMEVSLLRAGQNESEKFLSVSSRRVTSRRGGELGMVTVLHDITLEKQIDQMKDDFIHSITHDMRNPMTSIRGFLKFLMEEAAGPTTSEQRRFLEIIDRSSTRLLGMINEILDVAKLEAGRMELKIEQFSLRELMERVVESLLGQALKLEITLSFECAPEDLRISADMGLMERALINLAGNALRFTPRTGRVTLAAKFAEPERVAISVSDTGEGIPPEYLDKIFDKFQQVGGKARASGTGLGLTIVRCIVEAHRGKIWAESTLGEGSTFHILLPKRLVVNSEGEVAAA